MSVTSGSTQPGASAFPPIETLPESQAGSSNPVLTIQADASELQTSARREHPSNDAFALVPLDRIIPSKTNPRKKFDGPEMDELIESVRTHGILQPVLVRTVDVPEGDQLLPIKFHDDDKWCVVSRFEEESITESEEAGAAVGVFGPRFDTLEEAQVYCERENRFFYELVCGERRYRAAKTAGLREIPCSIRELADDAVIELQIVENLQRKDVSVLEEAEGYRQLLDSMQAADPEANSKGLIGTIAERIGKSVRYVYARMALSKLIPEIRTLVETGAITSSHADLVAKYDEARQREIYVKEFTDSNWLAQNDLAELREHIEEGTATEEQYLAKVAEFKPYAADRMPSVRNLKQSLVADGEPLKKAPWKWNKEKQQLSGFPLCQGCESNSASDGDTKDPRCTNSECYARKVKASIEAKYARFTNCIVPPIVDAVKVTKSEYSAPKGVLKSSQYVKAAPNSCGHIEAALQVNSSLEWEDTYTICREKKCKTHFPATPKQSHVEEPKKSAAEIEREKQRQREMEADRAVTVAILGGVKELGNIELALIAEALGEDSSLDGDDALALGKLVGWDGFKPVGYNCPEQVAERFKKAGKLTARQQAQVLVCLALSAGYDSTDKCEQLAKAYKIDIKAVRAAKLSELESAANPAKKDPTPAELASMPIAPGSTSKKKSAKSSPKKTAVRKSAKKAAKKGGRK